MGSVGGTHSGWKSRGSGFSGRRCGLPGRPVRPWSAPASGGSPRRRGSPPTGGGGPAAPGAGVWPHRAMPASQAGPNRRSGPGPARRWHRSWRTGRASVRSGEATGLDDADRQTSRSQGCGGGPFQATGGLQHDQFGRRGLESPDQLGVALGGVWHAELLAVGSRGDIEVGLGDIKSNETWCCVDNMAPVSGSADDIPAWPSLADAVGAVRLFGLESGRDHRDDQAVPRPNMAQAQTAVRRVTLGEYTGTCTSLRSLRSQSPFPPPLSNPSGAGVETTPGTRCGAF